MTEATPSSLACANCGHLLDPADKFCRECGLPTLKRAEAQRRTPLAPPDTAEFRRAMDAVPDPRPFLRPDTTPVRSLPVDAPEAAADSTSSVVKATSPTQTNTLALSTVIMLVLMGLFGLAGIIFLVLALLT